MTDEHPRDGYGRRPIGAAVLLTVAFAAAASVAAEGLLPVATGPADFEQPGTQPETLAAPLESSPACAGCHGFYDLEAEPYRRWAGSMMAQATRDPIFHAALAIANQDAGSAGELCIRCHSPLGWLDGRSDPPDGSALDPALGDFDGVSCIACHRMVDPVVSAENPPEDEGILAGLGPDQPRTEPHSGQFVIDPEDRRRGPYDLGGFNSHDWRQSPFHRESLLCANCHDVSNPALSRQPDGTYVLNDPNAPHPTHDKVDEFPIERTYSEWAASVFAEAPQETGGRFGGLKPAVSTCQDCHMPDTSGYGCNPALGGVLREDLPLHDFNGANSWVLLGVRSLYPDSETGLSDEIVGDALGRNRAMLEAAADLVAFPRRDGLVVRVVNRTGHKLPTGYGEGRRMWPGVRFLDAAGALIEERGAYDGVNAVLDAESTRVYEIKHGLDATMAAATGLPEGESFHFVLNNAILKDNRVPPRGYSIAEFAVLGAQAVDHLYPEQHYWDDIVYDIPAGAASVQVGLFHQTTSREYIEFLRDENVTDTTGQDAYDQWLSHGKSAPVQMAATTVDLAAAVCPDPLPYGIGPENGSGARSELGWAGTPSRSGGGFQLVVSGGLPDAQGLLLVGRRSATRELADGTVLVDDVLIRQNLALDAAGAAVIPIPVAQAAPGDQRYAQVAFLDPSLATGIALTSALHIDFCP